MSGPHVYVAIENALTDEQRSTLLATFVAMNPHYDGAHVADIIDHVHDADALLEYTEPFWDDHGGRLTEADQSYIVPAVIALVLAHPGWPTSRDVDLSFERVMALVIKARTP